MNRIINKNTAPNVEIKNNEQEIILTIAKQILEEYKLAFEVLGQWYN